jgi:fused signal recognition particle receptor
LEEALLAADVGARTTQVLIERVRAQVRPGDDPAAMRSVLGAELLRMLGSAPPMPSRQPPWVVLVTGVNGVGKTTTIGKLAARGAAEGGKVLVVAADTFRAAAIDQLAVWAERAGADIVRHGQGADPSAVVFDGMRAARAREVDLVLVDTAGRLHTRTSLMDELAKIRRTVGREIPGAPHEVLLVLDATTGQNALSQARAFVEAAGVTGVGVGEGIDDLRPFEPAEFVSGLLGDL